MWMVCWSVPHQQTSCCRSSGSVPTVTTEAALPNKRVQPTGLVGAILAAGSDKSVFPIYRASPFQPAAHVWAVGPTKYTSNPQFGSSRGGRDT
jgi:hypothetical protein